MSAIKQSGSHVQKLVEIMQRLLEPDGCPWDREQTMATLRPFLIEEAYEVLDAIDADDAAEHCEELGDLLLQIVFQAELRAREGKFGIDDVADAICRKMIHRHPHVFGDEKVKDATEVLANWSKLKEKEHADKGKKRRTLDGVPNQLPALLRAQRLGEKAAAVGFDWPDLRGVRAKIDEELAELDQAIASGDVRAIEHELGDVLFALSRLGSKISVGAEESLRTTLTRFTARFEEMERRIEARGATLKQSSLEEMNEVWEAVKRDQTRA